MTSRKRWERVAREAAIGLTFVGLAILMTWPLAARLSTAVHGPGDPYVSTSIIEWDVRTLLHDPGSVFDLPWFHPSRVTLAFTEHLLGIALVVLPFYIAGASPIALHSIATILGFAFCGYAASVLGRVVTGSMAAGLVAGVFYAFLPYRFHHATHISYVWSGWLPLLLASLIWYARAPSWKRGLAVGAAFFMNGLTCLHWLAFGSVAFAVTAVFAGLGARRLFDRRWWLPLVASTALATALLLPTLIPYRTVAHLYGMERSWAEAEPFSGRWSDWLMPPRENGLYGSWSPVERFEAEHPLFPGFGVLLLTVSALVFCRREDFAGGVAVDDEQPASPRPRALLLALDVMAGAAAFITLAVAIRGPVHWALVDVSTTAIPLLVLSVLFLTRIWIAYPHRAGSLRDTVRTSRFPPSMWWAFLWIAIGVIGSLGLNGFLHEALFRLVPPFRGMRVPLRWAMIAYVGLAVVAAAGLLPLLRTARPWLRRAVTAAILMAMLFELRAPFQWYISADTPPVYRWLASVDLPGGLLELPVGFERIDYEYLLHQTVHHRPLLNGISSFMPPGYAKLQMLAAADPIPPGFLDHVKRLDASLIIVHADDLFGRRPAVRAWLRSEIAKGRLAFVRRFDHRASGDYVFAVMPQGRAALRWREPELPDPSGLLPQQALNVFLERDAPTYNRDTFGVLESPTPYQDFRGELRVFGWALSPYGVASVHLLFDNGRVRIPADRFDAWWASRRYPWYGTDRAGFSKVIARPLAGLSDVADIQVEITDGRGRISRLEHTFFRWSDKEGLAAEDWKVDALRGLVVRSGFESSVSEVVQRRGLTAGDLSNRIVQQMKGRSEEEFIEAAFRIIFDRPPDPKAFHRWREKRARGALRVDVTDGLMKSPEFARMYLRPGVTMEPLR